MLTSEQAIVVFERGRTFPDRLTRQRHGHYVAYAEKMLHAYRSGAGRTRRELHRSVEAILASEPDCESRRIQAFCKLLDDESEYETDRTGRAAALRLEVFSKAAPSHPLVSAPDRLFEKGAAEVKEEIAGAYGVPWEQIEAGLYADVMEFQRLKAFAGSAGPEDLLSRYNVAQVQACLYRAERLTVDAEADFKTILRYAKLARLLHEITRTGPSRYRIVLSGPASAIRETRRYGVNMARFLVALLSCKGWKMRAVVQTPWSGTAELLLSDRDGLRSHLPPPEEFDSTLEERFAARFGAARGGWTLQREAEVVHLGQTAFVPDFAFRHEDGTAVLFEIAGFWTEEYLRRRRTTFHRFRNFDILFAVPEASLKPDAAIPEDVITYKTALAAETVLAALERKRASRGRTPLPRAPADR